jgi:hypothetical protein
MKVEGCEEEYEAGQDYQCKYTIENESIKAVG